MSKQLLILILLASTLYGIDNRLAVENFLLFKNSDKSIDSSENLVKDGTTVGTVYHLSGGGYIVSPSTEQASPIKAYSFDSKTLPEIYREFLINELYEFQNSVINSSSGSTDRILARWNFLYSFDPDEVIANSYTPHEILLNTNWNQGFPYNNYFPEVDGEKTLAGCVQVAVGQVMKYHNFPERGVGAKTSDIEIKDGSSNLVRTDSMTAVFDRYYNWDIMDSNYSNALEYQNDEVAYLMRDLGVVNEASMGIAETGANIYNILDVLPEYFNYSNTINLIRNDTEPNFAQKIRDEIDLRRPVLFSIPGHLTVVDGYHNDSAGNFFHINMGWGGSANDFYNIDENIVAGGLNFNASNTLYAILNVEPCNSSNGNCFINLESGDSFDGINNITGTSSDQNDSDIYYDIFLKGDTNISRQTNYYFLSIFDNNGTLLDTNATAGLNLSDLPLGKYIVQASHSAPISGVYYPHIASSSIDYNITITTGSITTAELDQLKLSLDTSPEIDMNLPHRVIANEEKILLNIFDRDSDELNLTVEARDDVVDINLTKNILSITPKVSDRASDIKIRVEANGKSVEKLFTVITKEEHISFGKEFSISSSFDSQNEFEKHKVILEGACSVTGDMGYSNTEGFYKSILDLSDNYLVSMTSSTINSGTMSPDTYQIGASLSEVPNGVGSAYPFDENRTGFRLDISCPSFDDNISNIANILGVDISDSAIESNNTVVYLPYEMNLTAGWNLISTPFTIDTDMSTIGGDIAYAFSYDTDWKIWAETGSIYNSIGYQTFSKIEPQKGYWINAVSDTNISIASDTNSSCPDFSTMSTGWNLVGSCSKAPQTLIDDNSNIYLIYKFEDSKSWSAYGNSSGMNSMISSIMPLTTEISAEDGLWVLIK